MEQEQIEILAKEISDLQQQALKFDANRRTLEEFAILAVNVDNISEPDEIRYYISDELMYTKDIVDYFYQFYNDLDDLQYTLNVESPSSIIDAMREIITDSALNIVVEKLRKIAENKGFEYDY